MDKQITYRKTIDGGVSGVLIGALTVTIVGWVKAAISLDPQTEAQISLGVGAFVSAILIAAERGIRNYLKHRGK